MRLTEDQWQRWICQLGRDVPSFFIRGHAAWAEGCGGIFTSI